MTATLAEFGRELRVSQQKQREEVAEENRRQGESFLARNRTNQGVICLPSGLQYQVVAPGKGQAPDLTNWVHLKFRGTRINGAEFEKFDPAHPETGVFSVRSVIQGWQEALQQMQPGARWRLFVPPSLAYGKDGSPTAGPNETLIYDLEMVSILPEAPQPTAEDLRNEREPDGD
jgi:FKBP-type peptidyl-prolyl cis-trans isomerase FklB